MARLPARETHLGRRATPGRSGEKWSLGLYVVYLMWFITLFDPQWLIASRGPQLVLRIPLILFGLLAILTIARGSRVIWYPPLLCTVAYAFLMIPFALNHSYALQPAKFVLLYYILAVGTFAFVQRPRQTIPIILMVLVYQYLWWGVLGARAGLVKWDFAYNNYDSFGPLMVMGITSATYLGLAARARKLRRLAFATAALCVVGLVSSFARGAVIGGVFVVAFGWMRSPRKLVATAGIGTAAVVVGLAATLLFSDVDRGWDTSSNFFAEMLTAQTAIATSTGQGTGRTVLWKIAWQEFLANPIFGVGGGNYGVYAATHLRPDQVEGEYADNPLRLYDRAVHNTYFQTLSERGAVGMLLLAWLLADFWRRNRGMKARRYITRWSEQCDGKFDIKALAIALETAMVGFLATGFFYNQLEPVNWMYSLLTLNALLWRLTVGSRATYPEHVPRPEPTPAA